MDCQKIIIDCDAGSDDALALIMLIEAHKQKNVQLLAITCVAGNTEVDNVVNNVFRVLHVCDGTDVSEVVLWNLKNFQLIFEIIILKIPVYKGAYSSLLQDTYREEKVAENLFHGSDGFGDVFKDKPDISKLEQEHAVHALQRIAIENYSKITSQHQKKLFIKSDGIK